MRHVMSASSSFIFFFFFSPARPLDYFCCHDSHENFQHVSYPAPAGIREMSIVSTTWHVLSFSLSKYHRSLLTATCCFAFGASIRKLVNAMKGARGCDGRHEKWIWKMRNQTAYYNTYSSWCSGSVFPL